MTREQRKTFLKKGDLVEIATLNNWNYDYLIQINRGVRKNDVMLKAIDVKIDERISEAKTLLD